jgi:hypothetical protein
MSVLNSCWDNIIGFTRAPINCKSEYLLPVDYDLSMSGLYLDELKGINLNFVEDTDGDVDLWTKVIRSHENAIRTFKMDVITEILKKNKYRYEIFDGNIGSQRYTRNLSLSKTYAGIRMYCNDIKGAYFELRGFGLLMNITETFTISIYDNLNTDPIYEYNVNSIANRISNNNITPIKLPLSSDDIENIEYYFVYTIGAKQPKDNKISCGCGGTSWCFNLKNPCFIDSKQTKERWRQYAMIGGITGNDLTIREDWSVTSEMNGLVIYGQFNCDKELYICNERSDFENDPVDQAIAYAILYKNGEFLMDEFLNTSQVSRSTLIGKEEMISNRDYYNNRYNVMINFIVDQIDISKYGCLVCKPAHGQQINYHRL